MTLRTEFHTKASLYKNEVFTVVPIAHELKEGILPRDQGFHNSKVFIWDTWRDLMNFSEQDWKKVLVRVPESVKAKSLVRLGSGFAIPYIAAAWIVKELTTPPAYID